MVVASGLSFRSYLVNFTGMSDVRVLATFNTLSVCCQIIMFTHEQEPTISRKFPHVWGVNNYSEPTALRVGYNLETRETRIYQWDGEIQARA